MQELLIPSLSPVISPYNSLHPQQYPILSSQPNTITFSLFLFKLPKYLNPVNTSSYLTLYLAAYYDNIILLTVLVATKRFSISFVCSKI